MAFGINRKELEEWKNCVINGGICFLTHYWQDSRFPEAYTVTKVGCYDLEKLIQWGYIYNLKPEWIDQHNTYPHFDLFGKWQRDILIQEKQWKQLRRFRLL
ncbi:MAG TPA: hypothetical protein VIG73_10365 [Cerasibacillus sp.]|uniref:hypothetical protein n=1 Tax=Cerasibacillus sp. TaxID=2498711 RepID=UPI002F428C57